MSELKEYRGEWFSPEYTNVKLPGILIVNQKNNDIKLTLYSESDVLGNTISERQPRGIVFRKIILGITEKGDEITLYNHSGDKDGTPFLERQITNGFYESVYKPNFAFIGKHFNSPESITFNSYSFQYNNLGSWINTGKRFFNTDETVEKSTVIKVPSVESVVIPINENCTLNIRNDLHQKSNFSQTHNLEIKHFVEFNFTSPVLLQEYLNLSGKFSSFLTLAVGFPISTLSEYAVTENMDRRCKNGQLEVFHTFRDLGIDNRPLFRHSMFFCSIGTRKEDLTSYISNWFKIYDVYQNSITLYVHAVSPFWKRGNTQLSQVHFTNGLLNICQAIESFYNQDLDIDYSNRKEDLNSLKNKVLNKIRKNKDCLELTEKELRFYLKNFKVPKHQIDVSYVNKIIHYLSTLNCSLNGFISEHEFDDFANQLKDYRNDLTHINHQGDFSVTYDLPYLFYHSQILFYAMIMDKVGIEQGVVNKILRESDKFEKYFKNSPEPKTTPTVD